MKKKYTFPTLRIVCSEIEDLILAADAASAITLPGDISDMIGDNNNEIGNED